MALACLVGLLTVGIAVAQPPAAQPPAGVAEQPAGQVPAQTPAVLAAQAAQILNDQLDQLGTRPRDQARLKFNFTGAKWETVLDWFCEEAGLSKQFDKFPPGTVNFVDEKQTYSIAQTQDLLNRLLLDRGFSLVLRGRMVFLIDQSAPLACLLYTSPSPRDATLSRMPSSA